MPLLAMIHTLHPEELFEIMMAFEETQSQSNTDEEARVYVQLEDMNDEQQDKVADVFDLENFTEDLAVQAVNELGFNEADGNIRCIVLCLCMPSCGV